MADSVDTLRAKLDLNEPLTDLEAKILADYLADKQVDLAREVRRRRHPRRTPEQKRRDDQRYQREYYEKNRDQLLAKRRARYARDGR